MSDRAPEREHEIPPITDPLGSGWHQPPREEIVILGTHAYMTQKSFDALAEYSTSIPTGVYPGKMWKSNVKGGWYLRWFGEHEDPNKCSNHHRVIVVVDSLDVLPAASGQAEPRREQPPEFPSVVALQAITGSISSWDVNCAIHLYLRDEAAKEAKALTDALKPVTERCIDMNTQKFDKIMAQADHHIAKMRKLQWLEKTYEEAHREGQIAGMRHGPGESRD
jgi:hypothetical protein